VSQQELAEIAAEKEETHVDAVMDWTAWRAVLIK